jgi:hypothetical protein
VTMQESTADAVVAAWHSLARRGDMPSVRSVRDELVAMRGAGASMRDIVPVVARLRAEAVADARVGEVVRLFRSLNPVARREALRRIREAEGR